jgi:drug efflux transport system ATP-binding protein
MSGGELAIRTKGLTRRFGDFVAVDAVDLHVERGSIFAFLGANGSGKSTTIRMLIGVITPTSGEIEVDGVDVVREPRRVREHIGYMGQKVSLYQGLSLRENAEFYGGLYGLGPRALRDRWTALLERFDLAAAEDEHPSDLSAGVRQRAGLALATLHRPRILFLDEPTAGVDVHNRALFWERIQEEADGGVTVFVTTHFLEEAEYCDRVAFIDAGRLVADASPVDLRRQLTGGVAVRLRGDRGDLDLARERLAESGRPLEQQAADLVIQAGALDPELGGILGALQAEHPSLRIDVEGAEMNDVFRALGRRSEAGR